MTSAPSPALVLGDALTSDFTVVAEGKEIAVHRSILTRTSPFLNAFLTADPSCTRINANNAKYEAMMIVLTIMYAAGTPQGAAMLMNATSASSSHNPFANSRYDFSVILSSWEISMHFQLTEVASTAANLLIPLLSRYTVVRALRSCLKHPKDAAANRIKDAAVDFLPPLLDTEEQRSEWRILNEKYIIVSQLVAIREERQRAAEREERARQEELAMALAEKEKALERVEREKRELSVTMSHQQQLMAMEQQQRAAATASLQLLQQQQQLHSQLQLQQQIAASSSHSFVAATPFNNNQSYHPNPNASVSVVSPAPVMAPFQNTSSPSDSVSMRSSQPRQEAYGTTMAVVAPPPPARFGVPSSVSPNRNYHANPIVSRNQGGYGYGGVVESLQQQSTHFQYEQQQQQQASNNGESNNGHNNTMGANGDEGLLLSRLEKEKAALEDELSQLKRTFAREQEASNNTAAQLEGLLTNLDAHDVELKELRDEIARVEKEAADAQREATRLQQEAASFDEAVRENADYIKNAKVYVPAAHDAVQLLNQQLDGLTRRGGGGGGGRIASSAREELKQLLLNLRTEKANISANLQETQKVQQSLHHHIETERSKIDDIGNQLMLLRQGYS